MATIHLDECDPQEHPDWVHMAAFNAWNNYNAKHCPRTEYMANELFPDEPVWVEGEG